MIIRVEKTSHYTAILNAPFRDKGLSWETRGLLAYLMTRPPDWEINFYDLLNQGDAGRDKLQRMLKELETNGYLHRYQTKGEDGRFKTVSTVYETPDINPYFDPDRLPAGGRLYDRQAFQTAPDIPSGAVVIQVADNGSAVTGKSVTGSTDNGLPVTGSADNGKAVSLLSTDPLNTDLLRTEERSIEGRKKDLPPPANGSGPVLSSGNGQTPKATPPHMAAFDALYNAGLTPEAQRLMNQVRTVLGVREPTAALDLTQQLAALGVNDLSITSPAGELLAALKRTARGVKPLTLAESLMGLIEAEATAAEIVDLFSTAPGTFWTATSQLSGRAWPSQIVAQLSEAREWRNSPQAPAAAPNGKRPATAASMLANAAAAAAARNGR